MKRYRDVSGDSGVAFYDYGDVWIDVVFKSSNVIYRYTNASAGARRIRDMKRLADAGNGLSTYISQHIRENYESRRPLRR